MLFEQICRQHGITARLTRPRSPTTTGKIERWHGTLRRELLDNAGPFTDLAAAQAAIDAWVHAYNHARPHQALAMATPASLFRPAPPQLPAAKPEKSPAAKTAPARPVIVPVSAGAVEFHPVIARTGLVSVLPRVQRVKLGPERAGQLARIWADEHSVHILIGEAPDKTVASNLSPADLNELRLRGARPAGPPPAAASVRSGNLPAGAVIEASRTIDGQWPSADRRSQAAEPGPGRKQRVFLHGGSNR